MTVCTSWKHNFQKRSTALLLSQITLQALKNSPFVSVSAREWCSHSPPPSGSDQTRAEGCVCVWHKTTRGLWQRGNRPFGQHVSQTRISHTERFIWWWLVHSAFSELLNETDSFKHIRVKWIVVGVFFLITFVLLIRLWCKNLTLTSVFHMCPAWWVRGDSGILSSVQAALLKVRA